MNQTSHQADNAVANANTVAPARADAPVAIVAVQGGAVQAGSNQAAVAAKPLPAGKPLVPTAAAAIQMEQEAAAGQARQNADKLLRKKRLGEPDGGQDAASSADVSYDVAVANTSEPATPPAEVQGTTADAPAAGASTAPASAGSAWLPVLGGGLGLAAIGGGGGGAAAVAATAATTSTFAVSFSTVAGPVTAALNYKIYDAQGNVVATGVTDATGKVTVNLASTYAGQALLIKITDANGTAADYRDETTDGVGTGTSLGGTALRAAFVATGSSQSIAVTPLTDLAVQKMGITTDAATASVSTVNSTNASVGVAFGVADILGAVTTVLSADYNEGDGLSAAEIYAQVLAKFSGQDQASGSVGATVTAFLAALNIVDPVARQAALDSLLTMGTTNFEAGTNTAAVTLINNPTLVITDSVGGSTVTNHAVTYTFTFTDPVTGFDAGDITVTNGTKGSFTAVSSTVYTLVVTPLVNAEGADIGVTVNSGVGGIGHHTSMTATIAQNAAARPYDTIVPAAATINAVATDDVVNGVEQTATITGTNEAGAAVDLSLGGNTRTATVTGTTWSYTLTAADITAMGQGAETLSVTQTDAAGNTSAAATRDISVDTLAPTVSSVVLTSATGSQNNTLNAGDTVTATVNFSEAVTVTGTPQLALDIGGTTVQASYAGGSGATALTFSYTILAGQTDADGIAISLDSLALNTGTIKDAVGNDATLAHAAVVDNASYMVDTTAPATASIDMVATDDVINAAEQTVAITGTNEAGATVDLSLGSNTRTATVTGTTWSYTLTAADITAMGQDAETLSVTQTDAAGNTSTAATRDISVDTLAPTISSVVLSSATGAQNNTLDAGDTVTATVNFSEAVTVTGTSQLALDIGGTTVQASYTGGTGTTALTFSYTILAGQTDTNGIAVAAGSLALNSSTIKDAVGNDAALAHTAVADNAGFMVDTTNPAMATTSFNTAENGTAAATLSANDAGAVSWSTTLTGADAALFSLTAGGVLTFNAAQNYEAPGDAGADRTYDLGVQFTDAAGNVANQAITVNLTDANDAPTTVGTVSAQTAVTGQAYSLDLSTYFADVDAGDHRHYSATGLEPGLSIDANTGVLSGTASAAHTASPVVVTMTDDGGLSTTQTFNFGVVSQPTLSSSVDNVTNFDVRSNIVLTASENVDLTGVTPATKFIHLVNTGGPGYYGENTAHSYDIDVTDSSQVTISGNKITLNPTYDLDLANNYYITIDAGAFHGLVSGQPSLAISSITAMDFSTVTPGTTDNVSAAVQSQSMDAAGALVNSYKYLDVEGIGNNTGSMTALGSLSGGQYALVIKNYEDLRGGDAGTGGNGTDGVAAHDTNIGVTNFGIDDVLYVDSQFNSATARYALEYSLLGDGETVGGVAGQNLVYFGMAANQAGTAAHLVLGFEGNTSNTIFSDLPGVKAALGWTVDPVIQG